MKYIEEEHNEDVVNKIFLSENRYLTENNDTRQQKKPDDKKLSKDKIISLLKLVYYEKKSIKQSARYLSINYNTAKRIIKQFRKNKLNLENENPQYNNELKKLQNFSIRQNKDSTKSLVFSTENYFTNCNVNEKNYEERFGSSIEGMPENNNNNNELIGINYRENIDTKTQREKYNNYTNIEVINLPIKKCDKNDQILFSKFMNRSVNSSKKVKGIETDQNMSDLKNIHSDLFFMTEPLIFNAENNREFSHLKSDGNLTSLHMDKEKSNLDPNNKYSNHLAFQRSRSDSFVMSMEKTAQIFNNIPNKISKNSSIINEIDKLTQQTKGEHVSNKIYSNNDYNEMKLSSYTEEFFSALISDLITINNLKNEIEKLGETLKANFNEIIQNKCILNILYSYFSHLFSNTSNINQVSTRILKSN